MHSCRPEDLYNDIIAQPPSSKSVSSREVEIMTEDEQEFLSRQMQLLQQQPGPGNRSTSPARTPSSGGKSSSRTSGAGQGSPSKKVS